MLKIQTMSNHNSEILIYHKMMQSYQFLSLKKFTEHVWTCPMWIDNSKISDANWYNSSKMSRLFLNTYDVICYNCIISYQSWNSHVCVSSVVEFQRRWVLKSKLFAQESTCSKEILIPTSLNYLWCSVVGVLKVDYLDFPCKIFEILCELDVGAIACNF